MTDIAKLQTAIDYLLSEFGPHDPEWPEFEPIYDAARELLTLREAGALIITPDENGEWPEWAVLVIPWDDWNEPPSTVLDALRDAMPDGNGE